MGATCRIPHLSHTRRPLNPALATGLLHSILRWQQDCSTQSCVGLPHSILRWAQDCPPSILRWAQDCLTQSCAGHRIAPLNPVVSTGLPRCLPQNCGSALLYSKQLPHSPPGLPASNLGSNAKEWGRSSCFLRQSIAVSSPLHFPRAIKIGQNRGSDQPDSGAVSRRL